MPRGLAPDVMLTVTLDAICSRNRYTRDPAPVIDELRATAGDQHDLLVEAVGTWVGYRADRDPRVHALGHRLAVET